jgi:DNA-binding PadR family transcriptional regulator
MSIKHGLLALLSDGPRYGYDLRAAFEGCTGGAWPLNVGQVYTTLGRLERDGLVVQQGADDEGHVFYAVTAAGREELRSWFETPVERDPPPRDELSIKIALAAELPGVDVAAIVQRQRSATVATLQALTRQKAAALDAGQLGRLVVLDALLASADADARFLDTCDARLSSRRTAR